MLVLMEGDTTGFIQANDTDLNHHLKGCYRNEEMALMLKKLEVDKNQVPSPTREQMTEMLLGAWKETDVDFNAVFKKGFVTNEVDLSEDFLVSDTFFSLIVDDVLEYRRQLLNSDVPAKLQTIAKRLIPPKGIRRKNIEGSKQLDYMEGELTIDDLEPAEQSTMTSNFLVTRRVTKRTLIKIRTNCQPNSALSHLFQNICNDPEVNEDAKFLDNLWKVFEGNETSTMFKPHLNKVK